MIRVVILAETAQQAQTLAELLAEEQQLDIVAARAATTESESQVESGADVLLAAGLPADQIPEAAVPVVVLTETPVDERQFGREVRAWLPLSSSVEELAAAIIAAAHRLVVLTLPQARRWLRTAPDANEDMLVEALTPRELQVLRMLGDGLGNKEIAVQLGVSDHTAKFHVSQILAKLGAGSRAEAVAIGMRRGLVPI